MYFSCILYLYRINKPYFQGVASGVLNFKMTNIIEH